MQRWSAADQEPDQGHFCRCMSECKPHPDATPLCGGLELRSSTIPSFEALVGCAMNMAGVSSRWKRLTTAL